MIYKITELCVLMSYFREVFQLDLLEIHNQVETNDVFFQLHLNPFTTCPYKSSIRAHLYFNNPSGITLT